MTLLGLLATAPPTSLTAAASLWGWWQPSVLGTDMIINGTLGWTTPIRHVFDRAGSGRLFTRLDGDTTKEPTFVAACGVVRRPALAFAGAQSVALATTPFVAVTFTTSAWTLGFRVVPQSAGGAVFGWGAGTARVAVVPGTGVVVHNGTSAVTLACAATVGAELVVRVVFDGTTVTVTARDLTTGRQSTTSGALACAMSGAPAYLGQDGAGGNLLTGQLGELAFLTTNVGAGDGDALLQYLANPLASKLTTAGRPYLLGLGDSLMAQTNLTPTNELGRIQLGLATTVYANNRALNGNLVNDMLVNFGVRETNVIPDPFASGATVVICVSACTNTLRISENPVTTLALIATYVPLLRTVGGPQIRVVPGNCLPRDSTVPYPGGASVYPGFERDRLILDAALTPGAVGADAIANLNGTVLGPLAALMNADWYFEEGDGNGHVEHVHLTTVGQDIAAVAYRAAMAPWLV